jgi:flagellar basal-body rod protein FlgB
MPDPISDNALAAILRRQMTLAAAQELVSAGNLANLSTPGYKAQETFEAALDDAMSPVALATTDARHIAIDPAAPNGVGADGVATREVEGLTARRDGNTVQLDRELLSMARAGGEFKAAQTALAAKFRLVRYALTEGGR